MENVEVKVGKDGIMTITVDTKHRGGLSSSGKTVRIASTGGNKEVATGIYVGLNVYTYPNPKQ